MAQACRGFGAGLPGFPLQVCKKRLTCNTRRSGRPICVAGRTKNADLQHFRTRPEAQRPSLTQHRDFGAGLPGFWRRSAGILAQACRGFGADLPGFPLQVCKKRLTCNTRRSGRPISVAGRTKNADLQHFRTRPAAQGPSLTHHRGFGAGLPGFWRRSAKNG